MFSQSLAGYFTLFSIFILILVFSKVLKVWIAQRPPGFGFVLMSDVGDAEDAVRGLHGTKMWGRRWVKRN